MRHERHRAPSSCSISAVCRCAKTPYAATLPWHSEKCVRSDGVLPAPEMPDLASTMTSVARRAGRRRRAAPAREAPPSDSSPGWRPAAPRGSASRSRSVSPYRAAPAGAAVSGYQRCARASSRSGTRPRDRSRGRRARAAAARARRPPPRAAPGTRRPRRSASAVDIERRDRAVPDPRERRQRPRRAGRRPTTSPASSRDGRMARRAGATQFLSGVAGGAGDGDARDRAVATYSSRSGARHGDCMHQE